MDHFQIWRYVFVSVVVCISHVAIASNSDSQEIVFGLIAGDRRSNGARDGVENAVNEINKRTDLLSDYRLKSISLSVGTKDECDEASVLVSLLQQIANSSQHRMMALLDAGCASATEAIAKISHYYNITQISCTPSSYELSDGTKYPYYFQLLPSEINLARVFYSIIKDHEWRRVALIVQNEHRYRAMIKHLKILLSRKEAEDRTSIDYVENLFNSEDGLTAINDNLFDPKSRIFVVAMDSKFARQLICVAHRLGLKYPKHLFITYGSYETNWWATQDDGSILDCSPEDRAEVLEYSLAALHYAHLSENYSTESCQRMETESWRLRDPFGSYVGLKFYQYCFDAILALTVAVNKTVEDLSTNQMFSDIAEQQAGIQGFQITDFNYNVGIVANRTKVHLEDICFEGLSVALPELNLQNHAIQQFLYHMQGPVRFDENGEREATDLRVLQYRTNYINGTPINESVPFNATLDQKLVLVDVAYVNESESALDFPDNYARYDIWPNLIPHDGVADDDISTVIVPVAAILILFEIVGLVFAIVCLMFNIAYRNKKLIRLSSPNLNYLIITGTLLVYSSGIAFALPVRSESSVLAFCFVRTWLLTFGFTCGFAPIVAKMWRVYFIFRSPQATKRKSAIQDWHLLLFVLSLLVMNFGVMCLHILLEGVVAKFGVMKTPGIEMKSTIRGKLEIPINFLVYQCSSHLWIRYFILAVIYTYLAILQICALYFAFQTRKVKVKGINDARYIALIVYIVGILVLINLVTTFALPAYVTIYTTIYSSCLWLSSTAVLGLSFIPKMIRLYKDPKGETVFTAHEEALQITTALGDPQLNSELNSLRKMIKQLEVTITEYKRITGLNLTKQNRLTTSLSMINLSVYADLFEEKEKVDRRGFKVSFELHPNNPPSHNHNYDDRNNCEVILENAPYSDSD